MKNCYVFFVALAVSAPAHAQVGAPSPWSFELTPYFWSMGSSGVILGGANAVEFDFSAGDLAEARSFQLASRFEAQNGDWTILGDLSVVSLQASESGGLDVDVDQFMFEAAGAYHIEPWLEFLFGLRYQNTNLDFQQSGTSVGERNNGWVDPFLGGRVSQDFRRWRVEARADAGGGLIGSDLAFNGYATLGFRPVNLLSLVAGYRVLDVDYVKEDGAATVVFDVNRNGPMFSVTLHF
jgi:hypothetical protein